MALDWTNPILKWGAVASALIALSSVAGLAVTKTRPLVVSGPLPAASEQQVAQSLQSVQKRIDSDERQNRDEALKLNALRRKAVVLDILELQAELKRSPGSIALKSSLDQDQQDLQDLADEHRTLLKGK